MPNTTFKCIDCGNTTCDTYDPQWGVRKQQVPESGADCMCCKCATKAGAYSQKPTAKQEGGNHYTDLAIQPMEYSEKNNLTAAEHTVIKYVTRHRFKNGLEDIKKAKHTLELLAYLQYGEKI